MALKIGRQKKIQIIDGQQVEVLGEDEDDEEDYDELDESDLLGSGNMTVNASADISGNASADLPPTSANQKMMAVEGSDGQQYVVLEVIQLPENAENVDVKPNIATGNVSSGNAVDISPVMDRKPVIKSPPPKKAKIDTAKKRADLASAFGFDDDEDDDE